MSHSDIDLSQDQIQDPQDDADQQQQEEELSEQIDSFHRQLNEKALDESFANSEEKRRYEFKVMIDQIEQIKRDYREDQTRIKARIDELTDELRDLEIEDKADREEDQEDVFDIRQYLSFDWISDFHHKVLVAIVGLFVTIILVNITLDLVAIFLAEPPSDEEGAEGDGAEDGGEGAEDGATEEDSDARRLFALNQYFLQ